LERGVVERERGAVGERDGRRRSRRARDESRFAEQIARTKDHQASLGRAHTLDETHAPFLQEKRFASQFPLAVDDLTGGEAFSESLQEPLALAGAEVLHGKFQRIIIFPSRASCRVTSR
jgi:hypothetical protein